MACATHIINSKISKVIYMLDYANNESMEKLKKNSIEVIKFQSDVDKWEIHVLVLRKLFL